MAVPGRRSLALLLAAVLVAGCGDERERASLYRAEKLFYEARKAETEVRLGGTPPDSAAVMRLREGYRKIRGVIPGPYRPAEEGPARGRTLEMIRLLGSAEAQSVRLAMEARRPDLALEAAQALKKAAAADSATARQAAFMTVAALQGLHRYDEAVAEMKDILRRFPPGTLSSSGDDPILALPETIVNLKRNLGDDAAALRELREALSYYQSLLARPAPPALEAQIRARVLRTSLELDQPGRALAQVDTLERLVESLPELRTILPEVAYAKGKIRATMQGDMTEGIALLDRVAADFPTSPFAPRASFEAAALLESKGRLPEAKVRYEALVRTFPTAPELAPLSMYRLGLVEDRLGDWAAAKATLEGVPLRYPQSQAAAEAPVAVIEHYVRAGKRTAAESYFPKALTTYRDLIGRDSTGQFAPLFRAKMFQLHLASRDSTGLFAVADEMMRYDSRHPYTAQVLLQAAGAATQLGNTARAAVYWRQFLRSFPDSPLAPTVRRELNRLGG